MLYKPQVARKVNDTTNPTDEIWQPSQPTHFVATLLWRFMFMFLTLFFAFVCQQTQLHMFISLLTFDALSFIGAYLFN